MPKVQDPRSPAPDEPLSGPPTQVQCFAAGPLGLASIGLVVFLSGYLTLLLPRAEGQFTPIGLVDSVLLAVLLMVRRRHWARVCLAAAVGELAVAGVAAVRPDLAVAMTASSLLTCTICAQLVLRVLGEAPDMARVSNIARYLGIVAAVAVGGALLVSGLRSVIEGASLWPNAFVWASREFTGMAALTPCLIILALVRPSELRALLGLRAWPLGVLFLVEAATFGTDRMPLTYVLMATLLLVTWRLRMLGAAIGILMTFVFAVPATLAGHGPFADFEVSTTEQLLSMQLFLGVMFHVSVPVAAALARSRRLQAALGDALRAVHESEAQHRLVAETMRDLIVRVDREGRIVYVSPSSSRLGYRPEDMVGRPGEEFVHPDDVPRLLDNLRQLLSGRPDIPRDRRHRLRLKDGSYRWFEGSPTRLTDAAGEPVGVMNVFRDIHDQRLADEALAASEARYRLLADNMSDIVACYGADGVITFATGATREVLGYQPHEIVGRATAEMIHPDDREAARLQFVRHREAGPNAPPFRVEYRMARHDGAWVWLQANPRAVFDSSGAFVEWQDVVREISESKALERELRDATTRADAAARTRAEFLADMSHEVRGPLNSVIGFARIARSQKERVDWCMDCIEEAARSLLTMVGDIMDYSRLEADQVQFRAEPMRLPEFLAAAMAQLEPQARTKALQMVLVGSALKAPMVATDANRLRQVLINLLGNAVKFTHSGEVMLRADYDAEQERLVVAVSDTGPGIPTDHLPDLFVRFSPAQPSNGGASGGVGLGLAISKTIVERLGGEISVESEPGHGSTFRFWIPAPRVDEAEGRAHETGLHNSPALRILVATAETPLQQLVAGSLARRAEVLPADDLAAATRLAAQESLDLIIVDLALARGSATLRRLRKASGPNSRTPALAFSNETSDELQARVAGQGFQGVLAKDSSGPELVSGIAEALLSADQWDRAPPASRARGAGRASGHAHS